MKTLKENATKMSLYIQIYLSFFWCIGCYISSEFLKYIKIELFLYCSSVSSILLFFYITSITLYVLFKLDLLILHV